MGDSNSDDHYIYCCGQESLKRNGVALIVNRRIQNAVLGCTVKNDRMISVPFQVDWLYEDLQHLIELTPKKK